MISYIALLARAVGFFLGYFTYQLIRSNLTVSWDIVTPGSQISAGIVRLPLRCRSELEITMLANLISLTPGTLTLAVHREPAVLYVHGMYAPDARAFREELYDLEARMLRGMRRSGDPGPLPSDAKAGGDRWR